MSVPGTSIGVAATKGVMMNRMGVLRRAGVAACGAVVLMVAFATAASAHAVLESTDPVAGSTVGVPPTRVELTFGESVTVSEGSIRLFDGGGHEVTIGSPFHPDGNGPNVESKVPKLPKGTYVVAWRVISADSHPVNGAFTFNVGAATANASGLVTKFQDAGGSKTVGVVFGIDRWLGYATTALVIGGLLFASWCWSGGTASERARRWLIRSALAGAVVSVAAVALQGAYGGGFGVGQIFRPSLWWETLGTRFGRSELLRIASFVAAVFVAWALPRARSAAWRLGALALSLGLAVSISFAGHGATGRWVAAAFALDMVHVLAFSVWIGGLVGLVAWALRDPDTSAVIAATRRFSTTAMVAVAAVVISGTVQGIRQVGTLSALTSTTYGWLLVAKVAVVIVVVGVAWVSRTLVRAFVAPEPAEIEAVGSARVAVLAGGGSGVVETTSDVEATALPDEPEQGEQNDTVRRYLRRSVGVEIVGVIAVLVLSTLLSATIPAGEAAALPFDKTIHDSSGFAQIEVLPAKAGSNQIHVTVTNDDGTIPNIAEMDVELVLPAQHLGPIAVSMEQLAPNHFVDDAATIPFPGTWNVIVRARIGQFEEKTFQATVPVH